MFLGGFIHDLEGIVNRRFKDRTELERYLQDYFVSPKQIKLTDFEGELTFTEDNHLVGVIGNYDIDIWYLLDNEKQLYITEVCWEENDITQNEDLEFYDELEQILNTYSEDWEKEPLDGDEVDKLVEILRKQLNVINGNITMKEYLDK